MSDLSDLLHIGANTKWMEQSACAGYETDLWFPDSYKFQRTRVKEALKVCAGCPVKQECLKYALDNDIREGIWGGKTEFQRGVNNYYTPVGERPA